MTDAAATADRAPHVLISYAWDTTAHAMQVRAFSDWLRQRGIEAVIDQYQDREPPSSWPTWMLDQIDQSDFVLVVASPAYFERASGRQEPGVGLGATWEFRDIAQRIYQAGLQSHPFIPVALTEDALAYIPPPLDGTTYYVVGELDIRSNPKGRTRADLAKLYARLTGVELAPAPAVGDRPTIDDLFDDIAGEQDNAAPDVRELVNWHPEVAYLRGVRALSRGDLEQAVAQLTSAYDTQDPALRAAVSQSLVAAYLQQGDVTSAASVADDDASRDLIRSVEKVRGGGLADALRIRLRDGDPTLAALREALHEQVVDELAGTSVENDELLTSAGIPSGCTGFVNAVESTYQPTALQIEWVEQEMFAVVTLDVTLTVDVDVPTHLVGELTDEQQLQASGSFDDVVWSLQTEIPQILTVRVPYSVTESFGVPEIDSLDLASRRDW